MTPLLPARGRQRASRSWVLIGATGLLAVVGPTLLAAPAAAADTTVPYTDDRAVGQLTLCDRSGRPVTSGSTTDKPFVWSAVSDTAGRPGYTAAGRSATLFGFQPRENVDPSQWSGTQLTASARYSNPTYPKAQATERDLTLRDLLGTYPARWDGLFQLRVYLGAPGLPVDSVHYATADIRVTGDRWALMRGGDAPCKSGSAVSLEAILPASNTAGLTPSATPSRAASSAAVPAATSGDASTSSTSTAREQSPDVVAASSSVPAPADSRLWVVGVVVVLAGLLAFVRRPWHRPRGTHSST
jgi:hypothetical protein